MRRWAMLVVIALGLVAPLRPPASWAADPLDRIQHVIVIYQENWSFDGLFGLFPGANGIANAGAAIRQVDRDGRPYAVLPPSIDTRLRPPAPDPRIPLDLPVAPYNLAQFVSPVDLTGDLVHEFYREQHQINEGKMDKFIAWSDAGGLVMSYYDATNWPTGRLAREYVLADNFFHAAFGGSFLNHQWLICACTPVWRDAPEETRARLDTAGFLARPGSVTPDGFVVNTSYSIHPPRTPRVTDPRLLVPSQTAPTIGDRLTEARVSWAWYAGGWRDAVSGRAHPLFQYHHQPFVYFAGYADGTEGRARHLKDEQDFLRDLAGTSLPAVSFIKPLGPDNEHPNYANPLQGQAHVAALVRAVMNSPYWDSAAIIITYDEHGGRWDHVPPPRIDRWGPGIRVPAVIVSPFAKRRYVDHTVYDTTSILRLIERRFRLKPLATRDAAANDLSNAFSLGP